MWLHLYLSCSTLYCCVLLSFKLVYAILNDFYCILFKTMCTRLQNYWNLLTNVLQFIIGSVHESKTVKFLVSRLHTLSHGHNRPYLQVRAVYVHKRGPLGIRTYEYWHRMELGAAHRHDVASLVHAELDMRSRRVRATDLPPARVTCVPCTVHERIRPFSIRIYTPVFHLSPCFISFPVGWLSANLHWFETVDVARD